MVPRWQAVPHSRYAPADAVRMREVEGNTLLGEGRDALGGTSTGEGRRAVLEREAEARLPLLELILTGD